MTGTNCDTFTHKLRLRNVLTKVEVSLRKKSVVTMTERDQELLSVYLSLSFAYLMVLQKTFDILIKEW